ncbi:hypothetical protein ACFQ5Q_18870 [Luteolibacter ambystomatis]|uniref:hypothetical protein n=1 Tax=Luteolibacter ambystomatis TaxID=2824561 RepID=UPI001CF79B85|nr:hypothetical protein [Luteolibacter ambystomatis]
MDQGFQPSLVLLAIGESAADNGDVIAFVELKWSLLRPCDHANGWGEGDSKERMGSKGHDRNRRKVPVVNFRQNETNRKPMDNTGLNPTILAGIGGNL